MVLPIRLWKDGFQKLKQKEKLFLEECLYLELEVMFGTQ
jgi:hypothetical protein